MRSDGFRSDDRKNRVVKVVLTGATGFAGGEILAQLLVHPRVARVTCVTRKALSHGSPKLVTVLHPDFETYEPALLDTLADHDACLWALGGKASDVDRALYERVTHTYTLVLAAGIASRVKRRFVFCYLSGMGADRSERAWLPWERETRHLKGRAERDLVALRASNEGFIAVNFRPGGIVRREQTGVRRWLAPITVTTSEVARAMIRVAIGEVTPNEDFVTNRAIQRMAM